MNLKYHISLFCGCGGSTTGYIKAGFETLLGVDSDPLCIDSYKHNYSNSKQLQVDIRNLKGTVILDLLGISEGELDLLDASPPCQGFSITGKRKLLDKRNDLIFDVIRIIDDIKPKSFVIENVDGMMKGKMRGYFNHILEKMDFLDYNIKWKSMNGIYYGLPQKRQRIFFIGIRKDLNIEPLFPTHYNRYVYFDDVISDVQYQNRGQFDKVWKTTKRNFCYTITKTPSLLFKSNGVERYPTIDELKILSSFPIEYKLSGSYTEQWGQIGNAVPPVFTYSIGKTLLDLLIQK
jgi:DNA (cytosine-5)-methyltransferase 1